MILWKAAGDCVHFDVILPVSETNTGELESAMRRLEFSVAAPVTGPQACPGTAGHGAGGRWYCPAPGCPKNNHSEAAGWSSMASLRSHVADHTSWRMGGEIPDEWFRKHMLALCPVCGKVVAAWWGECALGAGRRTERTEATRTLKRADPCPRGMSFS